jgi:UDP-GlcNAc:undecaprenyl-phosphate GlcNAc-1-phosphate transferase
LIRGFDPTAALLALVITSLALWLLQPVARRLNLLDHPAGRKDHAVPTPVTGGLAILLGCVVAFFAVQTSSTSLLAFCGAALLLVIVGIYDDLHDVRWYWRIIAQAIAALIIIYAGGVRVEQIGPVFGLGAMSLGWLSVPFTVFATIGLINAMNMIDGADGLAGVAGPGGAVDARGSVDLRRQHAAGRTHVSPVRCVGRVPDLEHPPAVAAARQGVPGQRRQRAARAGDCLGRVPADPEFRSSGQSGARLWLLPIPVMDCLVLIVRRLQAGRSPFSAGRDHIHHLMQEAGFGPTRAALWLAFFSLCCGLVVGQAMRLDVPHPLLLAAFLLLCIGWYLLTRKPERAVAFFRRLRRSPSTQLDRDVAAP